MPGFTPAVLEQLGLCCMIPCILVSQRKREGFPGEKIPPPPGVIRMHGLGWKQMVTWFSMLGPSGSVHVTGSWAWGVSNLVVSGQGSVECGESARVCVEGTRGKCGWSPVWRHALWTWGNTCCLTASVCQAYVLEVLKSHFLLHRQDFCGCFKNKATAATRQWA